MGTAESPEIGPSPCVCARGDEGAALGVVAGVSAVALGAPAAAEPDAAGAAGGGCADAPELISARSAPTRQAAETNQLDANGVGRFI